MARQYNNERPDVKVIGMNDNQWPTRSGVVVDQNPIGFSQQTNQAGVSMGMKQGHVQNNGIVQNIPLNTHLHSVQQLMDYSMDASGAGDASFLQNGTVNPELLNLDISRSQFDKVQRFDAVGPTGEPPSSNGFMNESLETSMCTYLIFRPQPRRLGAYRFGVSVRPSVRPSSILFQAVTL